MDRPGRLAEADSAHFNVEPIPNRTRSPCVTHPLSVMEMPAMTPKSPVEGNWIPALEEIIFSPEGADQIRVKIYGGGREENAIDPAGWMMYE